MKKLLTILILLLAVASHGWAAIVETTLWEDTYTNGVELNAATVATFKAGDVLRVYVTVPEGGANFKIVYKGAPDWSETTIPSIANQWPWVNGDETYKDFTLAEADITAFSGKNIYIYKGDNSTIIKVSLITEDSTPSYEGTELTPDDGSSVPTTFGGSWSSLIQFGSAKFSAAKTGDILIIYLSSVGESPAIMLQEYYGTYHSLQGSSLTISDNKAQYVLDASAAAFLKDNGMCIKGANLTVDKVTLKDGGGSASVPELNVSGFYDIVYAVESEVQKRGKRNYLGSSSTTAASDNQELLVTFAEGASDAKVIVSYVDGTADAEATLESEATTVSVPLASGKAIKKVEIRSTADDGTIKFTLSSIAIQDIASPATKYAVTISSATGGTFTVKNGETIINSTDEVDENTQLTLTATPDATHYFSNWIIGDDATQTDNPYSYTVTGAVTIGATFAERITPTIQLSSFTANDGATLDDGVFTTTADDKTIGQWIGDNSGVTGNKLVVKFAGAPTGGEGQSIKVAAAYVTTEYSEASAYADENNVAVVTLDPTKYIKSIYIQLTKAGSVTINSVALDPSYMLTITAPSNGSFTVKDGNSNLADGASVAYGTTLTLNATPATDYSFTKWTVNETDYTDNPKEITMTEATTVAATFTANAIPAFSLDGFVQDDSGKATYYQATHTLETTEGWKGAQLWIGDNSTYSGNQLVVRTNESCQLKITVGYTDGTESVLQEDAAAKVRAVTLESGKKIQKVIIQNQAVGSVTFTEMSLDPSYTLTITQPANGTIKNGESDAVTGTHNYGTELTLTAVPSDTYELSNWTDGTNDLVAEADGSLKVTMDGDKSVTAVFGKARTSKNLSTGSQKIRANSSVAIAKGMFTNAIAGDVLTINVSSIAEGAKYTLKGWNQDERAEGNKNWSSFAYEQELTTTSITCTLNADILNIIQNAGLFIEGNGFTCGDVTLFTAGEVGTAQTHSNPTYTLTVNATGGTVAVYQEDGTTLAATGPYELETKLVLKATPSDNYTFMKWTEGTTDLTANEDKSLNITMDKNREITAVFAAEPLANEERRTLWEGAGQALAWSDMFVQTAGVGSIVEAGEILIITASTVDTSEGHYPKISLRDANSNEIGKIDPLVAGENKLSITSSMATAMAGGFKFQGESATITKIELYKPTPITALEEEETKTLWSNTSGTALTWNTIAIDRAAEWGAVLEEDERIIISVKAKETGEKVWPTVQLQNDTEKIASTANLLNDLTVPCDITITLTAEMVNKMKNGFSITGDKATITKAVLYKPTMPAKTVHTLNSTETAISGDANVTVAAAKFANISAYDVLTVNFTITTSPANVILKGNGEDGGWDYLKEMKFENGETLFALPLTPAMTSNLKKNGLQITGSDYKFKSVTIKTAGEVPSDGEDDISNDASEEAKKVYNVLKDLYGKKIVSGVVANVDWNTKEAENVYNWTGKWPALNVYDFINLHASKDVNSAGWVDYSDITTAKNWWKEGGIVGAMWHWQVKANNGTDYTCTPGTAADETSFDASKVYVDGTSENTLAKQQLDQLCGYLKKMQDAGIPVVWRPLHEGSGNVEQYAGGKAWFWWGAKGADVYKQLWQWMYNYMVKTKGLNNLIWVWTSQTKDNNWYPGDAYVDIIGRDNYGATAATLATEYEALKDTYSNKMITLSECGNSETAEMAKLSSIWDVGSRWSWFMTWYDGAYNDGTSTTHKHADKTWWDDAMAKDYVVTRDQMKELLGQDSGGGSQTGVNISLDDLNEGWSSTYDATTKTITTTGEWAARGWYIGDDRYSQKGSITVKYEAVQFGVTLKMEYTNTNGDSKSVSAGAAAGETEVELDIPADVKTIEKVYITYQPIGTLKLTAVSVNDKVVDNRTEKTLVETSQAISDGDIKINRGLFSNAVAKDVLYIYATGLSDASKIALEPADYSGALDGAQWTAFTESPFTLKLTESALATIKEKGLLVRGENFTFTKATLYTESDLGSIIPDEEEPSIDPEVPSTKEPVINEGGEVKLDEVKAQDETTTVTYNKEEETLTITTTEPYKAAQIWLNEPEEVTNEVLKVEIAESNANVIVTVGYTDGTETSAASGAATAASRALSRGATEETGTVVTVPLSAGKEVQKIEIKNVEPGTITITSMSVTTLINEGETVTLWSSNEGETLAWNDIARQTTDLTNLLKEYDELLITVSARAEGNDWPKVFLRDNNYESVGRETLLNEVTTFPYIVRYVLTSELLEKIKNGFSVCGDGVTITKVELYRPVPPKEGDIHLRSLDYGYGSSYDASITTMTTTTRWAARGWEIGDMRYNSKDLVIIGYEAVDFPVTIKMEYVDDKGQKQATSTGVAAGQNYVQMAIPEGITQLDRVYLTYQNPGSLKLTEASVVTTGKARSRGFINDGVTTGIKDVKRGADMSDKWYDMNGRQVKQPSKGLYIKNGKKIMHK